MLRRLEKSLLVLLALLGAAAGLAWAHSSLAGYAREWSDPDGQGCGRFVSAGGRLLWQRCDLRSRRPPQDPALGYAVRMPPGFLVGTNGRGERQDIRCGPFTIPFTWPAPGLFVGLTTAVEDRADPVVATRWSYEWEERTVSYWLVTAVLLMAPAVGMAVWVLRRARRTPGPPLAAGGQPGRHPGDVRP
jgi:hypothetical protein